MIIEELKKLAQLSGSFTEGGLLAQGYTSKAIRQAISIGLLRQSNMGVLETIRPDFREGKLKGFRDPEESKDDFVHPRFKGGRKGGEPSDPPNTVADDEDETHPRFKGGRNPFKHPREKGGRKDGEPSDAPDSRKDTPKHPRDKGGDKGGTARESVEEAFQIGTRLVKEVNGVATIFTITDPAGTMVSDDGKVKDHATPDLPLAPMTDDEKKQAQATAQKVQAAPSAPAAKPAGGGMSSTNSGNSAMG